MSPATPAPRTRTAPWTAEGGPWYLRTATGTPAPLAHRQGRRKSLSMLSASSDASDLLSDIIGVRAFGNLVAHGLDKL